MIPPLQRNSCWRSGILSMARQISRPSNGCGLRCAMRPSLSISTSINRRGRSASRIGVSAAGSVSTMMITSRAANAADSSARKAICSANIGSFGLLAKTMTGRAIYCSAGRSTSLASNTVVRAASQRVSTSSTMTSVVSCAEVVVAAVAKNRVVSSDLIIPKQIGRRAVKAKGAAVDFCASLRGWTI